MDLDAVVTKVTQLLANPQFQPLLENLKKQNDQFMSETAKLLEDDDDSDDDGMDQYEDDEEEEKLEGATGKELAASVLKKVEKLFEYTSIQDKAILLIGTIFTIIHAASFPLLAILFGKISNAYVEHQLLEMQNTTLHPHKAHTAHEVGASGKLALSFLTKVTSKVNPKMNASIIPDAKSVQGEGYFGKVDLFQSTGNETVSDFADYVAEFSMYYVYIGLIVFVASFIQTWTWEFVAENQLYRIKQKYIYQLLRQELTWYSRRTAGNLVLKMADDCERFREGVGQKFSLVIEYIAIACFGAGIGLLINMKLTLVFLMSAPFIFTKLLILWKKIAEKSQLAQKEYAKAGKISSEVLMGVRTVAALSGEQKEVKRYRLALLKGAKAAEKMELLIGLGIGGMYFLIYSFYAVALWYSVNLLVEGVITPGEIYTVFFSLTICAFALGSLLPYINSIAASFGSIKLLDDVLNSTPNIDPYAASGERPRNFSGKIKFVNVSFAYPGREQFPVFKDLKLEIPGSGTVAIVGECSSGKSTIINLLLRFYDPHKGQIKFDNYDIKSLNVRWIREQISVVEQQAVLYQGTIFDNIRSNRKEIKMHMVVKAAKMALAHQFIMQLPKKYMTKITLAGGKDLSIGMRQRICIARSIIANAKVLVLDEAMSAIDVYDATKIEHTLSVLRKNLSTIIIAHKLAVARNADLIFVLHGGAIAEKGSHDELMQMKGYYAQMMKFENLSEESQRDGRSPSVDSNAGAESDLEHELAAEYMQQGHAQLGEPTALKVQDLDDPALQDYVPSISEVFAGIPDERRMLFLGIFGCLLSGIVIPVLSLCLGQILDMFLGDKEDMFKQGLYWVEVLIGIAIIAGVGYCARTICIGVVGEQLAQSMRLASYQSILRQPISWFDFETNAPGFLYARLASDIPFIRNAVGPRLGTAISAVFTMITGLIIATIFGWELALVASLTVVVLVGGFFIQKSAYEASHRKLCDLRKSLITLTNGLIKNIVGLQSTSRAYSVCQKAETFIHPAMVEGQKRAMSYAFGFALSEALMFFIFGIAFRLGAELIRTGALPISNLFTVFFVITFGSLSMGQATSFIPEYVKARLSASFIMRLIMLESPVDPYDTSGEKPDIKGQIEFRNVHFSYPLIPDVKICQGLNLTIPARSFIGIAGPVGGGKSTLLSIIERFYEIESGEVLIDGINIKDINLKHLRDNIGYVAQEPNLFDMSIRENILYGYQGNATDDELRGLVEKAAMSADADFITEELPNQYETRCGEHGKNLNPGQRQEIAIARAIIKDPPILLLDDPTSALDALEEQHVQIAMSKVCPGRTTVLVSNSYASIMYCQYIAVLVKGKIAEFGLQRDLLAQKGFYYQFVKAQGIRMDDSVTALKT